ncbi:PAS domain-containing sensor histidine kinase [Glaciecola sp. KUL10]|uniref:sensor histidine kinase n=1 Tax=Glaciecola sp. (strain KUL10) TaxID=2161813 RepID=UPI000D78AE00|nr:HAMP domain-containing sensor histidine kinase [Glaciecola sp. KUL10]GBL04050.1 sensory box sensor histidine kinase in two-component regulatory system [Glaciecola sp. KUL10]
MQHSSEHPSSLLSAVPPIQVVDIASHTSNKADELEELRKKSDRLTHLLQVMPAGVIVLDNKGMIRQANEQAVTLLGEPLEATLWRDIIVRSFKPQADDGHEVSLRDGRKVKLTITPLEEEKGQLIVITDLTETRDLQSRLSHLQKLSSLGKMVATLAHQVRTPLSSAMLYAANLKSLNLNNPIAEKFTNKLLTRLKDLESQVNDMLLFAKSGDQQIVKPVNAAGVVNAAIAAVDASAFHKKIDIQTNAFNPKITILGNETAISGAVSNLLHNAIQASNEHSSIKVVMASVTHDSKPFVSISVVDQGKGIDEAEVSKIFEPFYTSKSQGTGLGLAVVKSVAQSHKGLISARNNSNGVGASFELCLPSFQENQNFASAQSHGHSSVVAISNGVSS